MSAHALLVVLIGCQHVVETLRNVQFGQISVVQGKADVAVVVGIDDEVGRYLLHIPAHCLSHRGSGFRVQLANFSLKCLYLKVGQRESRLYFVPVFLCKSIKIVGKDGFQIAINLAVVFPFSVRYLAFYLQEQAFLQRTRSNACRVEVL